MEFPRGNVPSMSKSELGFLLCVFSAAWPNPTTDFYSVFPDPGSVASPLLDQRLQDDRTMSVSVGINFLLLL